MLLLLKNKVYIHEVIKSINVVTESFRKKRIWVLLCGMNMIAQVERRELGFQAMNNMGKEIHKDTKVLGRRPK